MRKNYFEKIVNYIKNVYNIDKLLSKIKDGRKNLSYKTRQVILPVLLGFILRIRSFNELNNIIVSGEFKNILPRA